MLNDFLEVCFSIILFLVYNNIILSEPSLTIIDSSLQQIGDAKVHTLHVKPSEGKPLNFAIEHGQLHQLKEG